MKKLNLLVLALVTSSLSVTYGQSFEHLDTNNIKARINANNLLFYDPVNMSAAYEFPINSNKHTFLSGNLIIGGQDINGQLHTNIPQLGGSNALYAGPIMDPQHYTQSTTQWDRVWKIGCAEIQKFKDWYQAGIDDAINNTTTQATNFPGYQIPQVIIDWPAHGDPNKLQAWSLAPFYDADSDGFYDPNAGDYPLIKGDQAIYSIYNDERPGNNVSMGTEVHVMAYAYANTLDSALDNTIFMNYKIINRSSATYYNTYIGFHADMDLGDYMDDYIGCDVERGAYYIYNGDNFDSDYDSTLAAQSVVVLNGPYLDSDGIDNPYTNNVATAISQNGIVYDGLGAGYGDGINDNEQMGLGGFMFYELGTNHISMPTNSMEHYNFLRNRWKDGTPLTYGSSGYGGTDTCRYMFPDNSDPLAYGAYGVAQTPWSEVTLNNPPADRRGIGSMGPFTMLPGAVNEVNIAFVSARDYNAGGNMAPITIMQERIDSVRSYFFNGITSSCPSNGYVTSIGTELELKNSFEVYPNPFNNDLTINYELKGKQAVLKIYNAHGQLIKDVNVTAKQTKINLSEEANGIYFIQLVDGEYIFTKKVTKN